MTCRNTICSSGPGSTPPTGSAMVARLADLEGGMIPLTRRLRQAGEKGFWPGRLRAIAQGKEIPPWPLLEPDA